MVVTHTTQKMPINVGVTDNGDLVNNGHRNSFHSDTTFKVVWYMVLLK